MPLITISSSLDESFLKHEIVPDVIDKFDTQGLLTIEYESKDQVTLGNTLTVAKTQTVPKIQFVLNSPAQDGKFESITAQDKFILVLTDPDAPSRTEKKWSEYAHWLISDLPLVSSDATATNASESISHNLDFSKGRELLKYEGPGPPPQTGKHRYVFLLFKQGQLKEGVKLPEGRPTWGTGVHGSGVRNWIGENAPGLKLLAANFFYAQDVDN